MECNARLRNFNLEKKRLNKLQFSEIQNHPLKSLVGVTQLSSSSVLEIPTKSLPSINKLLGAESSQEFDDPLSKFAAEINSSSTSESKRKSLSNVLSNELAKKPTGNDTNTETVDSEGFETWNHLKSKILSTFTTSKKLSLIAISSTNTFKKDPQSKNASGSVAEKVRTRLEQLDDIEEGSVQETLSLSQDEYVGHINQLGSSLVAAWKLDQRVKTLKIAIQCVKLLSDTSSKQFYPSKFIIISEILDNFGGLVFERLLEKATTSLATVTSTTQQQPIISLVNINPNQVSDTAKETCRNWIFKIASIRELLPRVYIEMSVLRCLDLLSHNGAVQALDRLLVMCRGVAHPLVSLYLRCYLSKVADSLMMMMVASDQYHSNGYYAAGTKRDSITSLASSSSSNQMNYNIASSSSSPSSSSSSLLPSFLMNVITDSLSILTSHFKRSPTSNSNNLPPEHKSDEERIKFLLLFGPSFDWMMRCVARCSTNYNPSTITANHTNNIKDILEELHILINSCDDPAIRSLLIGSFIDQSPSLYIASHSLIISKMIGQLPTNEVLCLNSPELYRRLGSRLVQDTKNSLDEDLRRPLLNEAWRCMTQLYQADEYMRCVVVWSAFIGRYFGRKEVNVVMGDVMRKMTMDRLYEGEQTTLRLTMQHLIGCNGSSLVDIIASNNFLPYMDMFSLETRAQVCRDVLTRFSSMLKESGSPSMSRSRSGHVTITDPVVIHSMMVVCKYLHDHVTAMTADEEVFDIGSLICTFLGTVSTESNEAQLGFYVKCRSTFYNIDPILLYLIHRVNHLMMTTEGGDRSALKKDGSFVRACCAYSFITIPSLNGVLQKMNLYNVTGQLALHHGCVSQADDFFRAAILLISQLPRYLEADGKIFPIDPLLLDFIQNLSSTILFVPDPPHLPPLSLYHLLLNQVNAYQWDASFDARSQAYASMLVSLSCLVQENLPYKMAGVGGNDALYGGDPKFLGEVRKLVGLVAGQLGDCLKSMDGSKAGVLALKLFDVLLPHVDPSSSSSLPSSSSPSLLHHLLKLIVANTNKTPPTTKLRSNVGEAASPATRKIIQNIQRLMLKDDKYKTLMQYFDV